MPPPTSTLKPSSPASLRSKLQADVVPAQRRAVFRGAVDGDLELARQEAELRVQRGPLADDFAERARIGDLVGRDARELLGRDVADGIAAGLDAVHAHAGEQLHHLGALHERDPVELHVGARGEVAVAVLEIRCHRRAAGHGHLAQLQLLGLRVAQQLRIGLVVFARDLRQHAQLRDRQLAVGHRDARHRGVALDVPAVLQAQRAKLVLAQLAGVVALQLVAVLGGAVRDELLVEFVVLVHVRLLSLTG